ncbi:MAG: hypothetical protein KDD45_02780, partial [Bdellovibrionales bacterium]|nr:hypothetical protein [Bdellovibrionales bacterium]
MKTNKIIFMVFFLLLCSKSAFAKARYITCPEKYPAAIRVPLGDAMIMEFPEKPKHSLPGKNAFDFQYIGKDIGIKSLRENSKANLFVYLGKKRCAFKLISVSGKADDI